MVFNAITWSVKRATSIEVTKYLNENIKDYDIIPLIAHFCSQAVIGHNFTTKEFKKVKNIPERKPIDDYLNENQLDAQYRIKDGMINQIIHFQYPTKESILSMLRTYSNQMKITFRNNGIHGFDGRNYAQEIRDAEKTTKKRKRDEDNTIKKRKRDEEKTIKNG